MFFVEMSDTYETFGCGFYETLEEAQKAYQKACKEGWYAPIRVRLGYVIESEVVEAKPQTWDYQPRNIRRTLTPMPIEPTQGTSSVLRLDSGCRTNGTHMKRSASRAKSRLRRLIHKKSRREGRLACQNW